MPGPIFLLFGSRAAIEQYAAWRESEGLPAVPSMWWREAAMANAQPEVTAEMVDAGVNILRDFEPGFDSRQDVVIQIYLAMEHLRARQRVDPMNLAAYGAARPHDPGKMAPSGAPWVGKGRKRK